MEDILLKNKIRQVVYEEYGNTLGIVAYKDNKKVYEDYFNNATKDESVHTFSIAKWCWWFTCCCYSRKEYCYFYHLFIIV